MKKGALVTLTVLVLISCSGCFSGPSMLSRKMDDWLNVQYTDAPWTYGNVASGFLFVLWSMLTTIIDGVVRFQRHE